MALLLGVALSYASAPAQSSERPNILYIVADDMRRDTIAALGNPVIETPSIDSLVRQGTVLSQANCAYPVCVPSRTEMLTGRIFSAAIDPHDKQPPTLAECLRDAGYETWHVGKWHMAGRPVTRGFTESSGLFTESTVNPRPPLTHDRHGRPITGYRGWVFQDDEGNEFPELGVGLTPNISERFADAAIDLLRRNTEKPFFLHLNFTSPHDPWLLPAGYENRYPPGTVPLPENFRTTPTIGLKTRDERLLPRPLACADVEEALATYYAQISHMDAQIGRVLDALRATGKDRNTIIVFVSDHGLALGSHGLIGKQNLYDHTLLVPCILTGPGIASGAIQKAQVYLRDVSATLLDMCGFEVPEGWDGVSLRPLLDGETAEIHPYLVGYYLDESRSVRTPGWKLVSFPGEGTTQLFNLGEDPLEIHDLGQDPAYADIVEDLRTKLQEWSSTRALPGRRVK